MSKSTASSTETHPSFLDSPGQETLHRIRAAAKIEKERRRTERELREGVTSHLNQIERWRLDPDLYAREKLGLEPWSRQSEILHAVADHGRVAVRSGHKIGKSKCAGALGLWFADCFPGARVIVTAPTHRQIRGILWRELKTLYREAKTPLGGVFHDSPDAGIQFDDGSEIVGFSTTEPERMAGISGPNVLFLVDEASGVPEQIFEAIEGNRAGGARLVLFSNPTKTSGTFFDAFHSKRDFWHGVHVTSLETPQDVPGLATRAWAEEKRREWGEESALYQVRVLGNFPSTASNAIISLADLDAAKTRWLETRADGRLHIGVDVARFGDDDSCIIPRRGRKVLEIIVEHGFDTVQIAGKALKYVRDHRIGGEKPVVSVDVIGVGGGVADHLRQFESELELVEVNSSECSSREDEFTNLRSQLAFAVSDWLREGGAIPDDGKLDAELLAPTYSFDPRGRRKVASKDEIKKILGRSPDRSDALALAVYEGSQATPILRPRTAASQSRWGSMGRGF